MRLRRSTPNEAGSKIGLCAGDGVRCRREPSLGLGMVIRIGSGAKPVLVAWDAEIETYHAPSELESLVPRTRHPVANAA